jgi:hypothetical protein
MSVIFFILCFGKEGGNELIGDVVLCLAVADEYQSWWHCRGALYQDCRDIDKGRNDDNKRTESRTPNRR